MPNREYLQPFRVRRETRTADLQRIVNYLKDYCPEKAVVFVHGRGKRKSMHQQYFELFGRFLGWQPLYGLHSSRFGSRNSRSKSLISNPRHM